MKKPYLLLPTLNLMAICIMEACSPIERVNSLRIVSLSVNDNLNVDITGEIIDTEKKQRASNHGFCWAIGTVPELGTPYTDTIALGEKPNESQLFSATIQNLLPDNDYYIRAFMVVGGNIKYSLPEKIRTRGIRQEDTPISIIHSFLMQDSIYLKGFVNKERVETIFPATAFQYGTIIASEPDSTKGISITENSFSSNTIQNFLHKYLRSSIPASSVNLPVELQNKYFAWAFVDYYFNNNPSDVRRLYTRRYTIER